MKKLILPLLACLCLSMNIVAQSTGACTVHDFTLQYISVNPSLTVLGKYDLKVNLTWEIQMNTGNKYSYFHIWEEKDYVLYDYISKSTPPLAADLSATLGTIVIKDPSTNPTIFGTYPPDVSYSKVIAQLNTGAVLSRYQVPGTNIERFTITNFLIPGVTFSASGTYNFRGDIWSSQHHQGTTIHCSLKDNDFVVNNVISQSLFRCSTVGLVNVRLKSTLPEATGTYQLFVDTHNPGVFDEYNDTPIGSEVPYITSSTTSLASDVLFPYEYTSSEIVIPSEYNAKMIWLVVSLTGKSNQIFEISNTCSALPVTFGAFSASRKGNAVAVKWQTTYELNVAGFNVQRLTSGNWTNVSFVPAKNLANGSSYEIADVNTHQGLSQYRIVSVDIDGKQKISEVRSVRGGEGSTRLTVYPNPSTRQVSLVFDNSAVRDISVIDMNGRVVKQLQNEQSTNVSLEITQDGMYQIQITDRTTGEVMVEKVLIKKR